MAQDEAKSGDLELWNAAVCPFGQRTWWAILEKKIPTDKYKIYWEDLGNKSDGFKAAYKKALFANPEKDGTTPTIAHNGKYLTESDKCTKYVDMAFDGPSLQPSDPFNQFVLDKQVSDNFGSLMGPMFAILKGEDAKGEKLLAGLQKFEAALNSVSKDGYLFGKEFTLFEILVFPIFYRFDTVEAMTGVPLISKWLNKDDDCDEAKSLPRVINWYNAVNSRETVAEMRKISTTDVLKASFAKFQKK